MNCEGGKMRLMAIILIMLGCLSGVNPPAFAGVFTGKDGFFTGPDKTFNLATCVYGAPLALQPLPTIYIKIAPPKGPKDIQKNWGRGSGTSPPTPASPICLRRTGSLPAISPPFITGYWTPLRRWGSVCGKNRQKYRISTRYTWRHKIRTVS